MSWKMVKVRVFVRLRPGVWDAHGTKAFREIQRFDIEGVSRVSRVRHGKIYDFEVHSPSNRAALRLLRPVCKGLMINPIIETFQMKIIRERNPWPYPA